MIMENEEYNKLYEEYKDKLLNDENYLQVNRPQEYFSRMINGDFYTDEEREIIAKRRNSLTNDEKSQYQVMGD